MASSLQFEWHHRPGRTLAPSARAALVEELRKVTATSLSPVPCYQVLDPDSGALDQAIISIARTADGRIAGFCSALLLPMRRGRPVLHLGLTVVHPDHRGEGLTHKLLSRLIGTYLLRKRPIGGFWFTNVASVLSSLGNISLHFQDVHPSPFRHGPPSGRHTEIAWELALMHRRMTFLDPLAWFCPDTFIFRGGNAGTVFAKTSRDARYHHRKSVLNDWFLGHLDLDAGDAQLQVGRVTLSGLLTYRLRSMARRIPGVGQLLPAPTLRPALRSQP